MYTFLILLFTYCVLLIVLGTHFIGRCIQFHDCCTADCIQCLCIIVKQIRYLTEYMLFMLEVRFYKISILRLYRVHTMVRSGSIFCHSNRCCQRYYNCSAHSNIVRKLLCHICYCTDSGCPPSSGFICYCTDSGCPPPQLSPYLLL